MKLLIICLMLCGISLAADEKKALPAETVPEISLDVQVEVLAGQLYVAAAEQKAAQDLEEVRNAKRDAQPAIDKATAQCNKDGSSKRIPMVQVKKVVCMARPEPPQPQIAPAKAEPTESAPQPPAPAIPPTPATASGK